MTVKDKVVAGGVITVGVSIVALAALGTCKAVSDVRTWFAKKPQPEQIQKPTLVVESDAFPSLVPHLTEKEMAAEKRRSVQLGAIIGEGCTADLICDGKTLKSFTQLREVTISDKSDKLVVEGGIPKSTIISALVEDPSKDDCRLKMSCDSGEVNVSTTIPLSLVSENGKVVDVSMGTPTAVLYQDKDKKSNE